MSKITIRKKSFQWHLLFAWVAAFALFAFCISGITHPLLSWTGPQSSAFMPPRSVMQAEHVNAVKGILEKHNIQQAIVIKLIPSAQGVVLQITEHNDKARRYFDLTSFHELPDYDREQAEWLARYYALGGNVDVPLKDITFQTQFDSSYTWVNRLLPVYKVTFDNDQGLSTYVYTEINALAGLSNNYKTILQTVFRNLHTWSWLNGVDSARVILMALLLLSIITMTLTGVALVLLLNARKSMPLKARIHRYLAYGLWLPLLMFSCSGFYHLLHYGFAETHRGLQLGLPISLNQFSKAKALDELPSAALNQISVIEHKGELAYRLSIAPPSKRRVSSKHKSSSKPLGGGEHAHHDNSDNDAVNESANGVRNARFDGQTTESGSLYYSVTSGNKIATSDLEVAVLIASQQLDIDPSKLVDSTLIKRFGLHYDFRNKRLPVWQLTFDSELGDMVFIDPATGVLVDRLADNDRYEGYSFSFLHKWNFLTPFIGRKARDIMMAITLLLIMIFVGLGVSMRMRHR